MIGVNHKKIRRMVAEKKKTINDRRFFASQLMAAHFADMAAAQTKRYGYKRKIKVKIVWEPKNGQIACTDNELIWINAGSKFITRHKGRPERYELICGLFTHELGHVLYTDFLKGQSYIRFFEAGKWYPEQPELRNRNDRMNESDIWDFCKADEKNQEAFTTLAHEIENTLEDGYIESMMLNRFQGKLGSCLYTLRKVHFENMPTLTQLEEKEDNEENHIWETIMSLLLSYVKFGEIKYGEEPISDERVQTVFSLLPTLDAAIIAPSITERWDAVNIMMVRYWHYIKEFLEICVEREKQNAAAGVGGTVGEAISKIVSSIPGASTGGSGDTDSVEEGGAPIKASAGAKRRMTARQAASEDEDESTNEEKENAENAGTSDESSANGEPSEEPSEEGGHVDDAQELQNEVQKVSSEEGGRFPPEHTASLHAPTGGEISQVDDYEGAGYTHAADDIERILEDMAERAVCTTLEKTRTSELNEMAKGISYGNIHKGVDIKVHRIADVNDTLKESYNQASKSLIPISRKLQKSVLQNLKDKRTGGKNTNLLMGRRLDPHALPRNDGHVFYKNTLPNDTPELSVGLLLDESGSMSFGDRATYARATAIILHDFCSSLNIPLMVYGHSTGAGVNLYSYAEFDQIDRNDRYRLMDISSRGSNRDGAALRYVAERLSGRPEDVKMLILVSDGQPADDGYFGSAAEDDLRGIMQEYRRKNVLFIAASIGDDRENLQRIYGDAFMDITDLNKLPVLLAEAIKKYMRVS